MGIRLVLFGIVFLLLGEVAGYASSLVDWTMINVNSGTLQGDAHLLRFADGENELLDTGYDFYAKDLISHLKRNKIDVLHKVLISHPHKDHYGALKKLLDSPIKIGEVWLNLPERTICDSEIPWGCDYPDLERTVAMLRERGVPWRTFGPGTTIHQNGAARFEVLYAYDGVHTPVGRTDVNDMSAVMLLTAGKTRVLFPGDLNAKIGLYLAEHGKNLSAQILKVPHHGTEGVVPNVFFDAVGPQLALVPSPRDLWLSERSRRIREYFASHHILTYVNGIHGDVRVSFDANGYSVKTGQSVFP